MTPCWSSHHARSPRAHAVEWPRARCRTSTRRAGVTAPSSPVSHIRSATKPAVGRRFCSSPDASASAHVRATVVAASGRPARVSTRPSSHPANTREWGRDSIPSPARSSAVAQSPRASRTSASWIWPNASSTWISWRAAVAVARWAASSARSRSTRSMADALSCMRARASSKRCPLRSARARACSSSAAPSGSPRLLRTKPRMMSAWMRPISSPAAVATSVARSASSIAVSWSQRIVASQPRWLSAAARFGPGGRASRSLRAWSAERSAAVGRPFTSFTRTANVRARG